MTPNKYYKDYTEIELLHGYNSMVRELDLLKENHLLFEVFNEAWSKFCNNKWSFDGATFVNEKTNNTLFEVAAFLHDYRNSMGYVGYYIDNEMFTVMILLNYKFNDILKRYFFTRITFINILRHKYLLKDYKNEKPKNLITI